VAYSSVKVLCGADVVPAANVFAKIHFSSSNVSVYSTVTSNDFRKRRV